MAKLDGANGLTAERVRELISYDPLTGESFWLISISNRKPVGSVVGDLTDSGHRRVGIAGVRYLFHRLVWLYMTGEWPGDFEVDHRDTDPDNNRWTNLRLATPTQNQGNKRKYKSNTSGAKCVRAYRGRFRAVINPKGRQISLGIYDTLEEASAAYEAAAREYFGEFARAA